MEFIKLREKSDFIQDAAVWFSQKWDIPKEAYIESMFQMMEGIGAVSQWYLVVNENKIIAGVGVIENDFHERKDLKPNLCALYVEEEYRSQSIARALLNFVYKDMLSLDIDILYLITDHVNLYEKLNWNFLTEVRDDDNMLTRMYEYKTKAND